MTEATTTPDLTDVPAKEWQKARRRLAVIRDLAELTDRTRADAEAAAAELDMSLSQLYRLLGRYEADPRLTSLLPDRHGPRAGAIRLPPEVDEVINTTIDDYYLSRQRPRVSDLLVEVRRRCRALGYYAPGRKAVRLRLAQRPVAKMTARRHGRKAAHDQFGAAAGSLDAPWPLSLVQIDHTLIDVIVVDSVTRAPIQRPWLTLAIDVHSRCVAGFHLALDAPSATSAALCIAHAALPKVGWLMARNVDGEWPIDGVPDRLHLDNAKEFHSEALKRGCDQYGIAVDYRPVRTPHYGGHIERLIGTMMGKVHLLPGTTFSNVRAKGDLDPSKSAVMTLEEVERWLAHAIVGIYHQELHRGIGTTPLAAWKRGILGDGETPGRGAPSAVADPRRFLIDFLPLERRLVRREGVFLNSIGYWSDVLRAWIGERERMIVRYDPRDLSRIYLLAPDGRYYDLSYCDLRRPPISLWEHRLALKRLREEGRAEVNEDTIFRAIEVMRGIAERASADSKLARRQRERRLQLVQTTAERATGTAAESTTPIEPLPADQRVFKNVEEWM
ncbi:Mu transposase C-terminal domain-containing protein [Bradyrhizobium sp. CCBAU 45389]|uniref:Mu transposase C-terminal domain-containing protein n=1 Tax=Bradyrhizobium sp. CCBAU 45389 TaxID=858429 RepID=UPI002306715F|nr:Mu transposase C-terminal domain-containing protein [Bradyrhizobium sp. CCBAU 45389]MDA9397979.1 integrase [Bradyrhizobium sp. CCBAU 45389]